MNPHKKIMADIWANSEEDPFMDSDYPEDHNSETDMFPHDEHVGLDEPYGYGE